MRVRAGHTLYQADTRPAAPGGVPLELFIGILMFFGIGAGFLMFFGVSTGMGSAFGLYFIAPAPFAWWWAKWWTDGDLKKVPVFLGWLAGAARTPLAMARRFGGSTASPLAESE